MPGFILASASARRLQLLEQVGLRPDKVIPADIDETALKNELPKVYVARVAKEKAQAIAAKNANTAVLAADTIVAMGRRIIGKAADAKEATKILKLMSGRNMRVYTAVVLRLSNGKEFLRVVETRLKCKRLSAAEIQEYVESGEWEGKAGACDIQGKGALFFPSIQGSYTNIVGLPLYETSCLLKSHKLG